MVAKVLNCSQKNTYLVQEIWEGLSSDILYDLIDGIDQPCGVNDDCVNQHHQHIHFLFKIILKGQTSLESCDHN